MCVLTFGGLGLCPAALRSWTPFTSVLLEGLVRGLVTGGGELDVWESARARNWDQEAAAKEEAEARSGKKKKSQVGAK